jgi:hypothetical protein
MGRTKMGRNNDNDDDGNNIAFVDKTIKESYVTDAAAVNSHIM